MSAHDAATVIVGVLVIATASVGISQQPAFKVIGNPSCAVDITTRRDLAHIFLKRKSHLCADQIAIPVDRNRDSEVRRVFSEKVLGKTIARVDSYWQGQVFSGKAGPPLELATEEEILDFVRSTPGAVGYVSATTPTAGVNVIKISD